MRFATTLATAAAAALMGSGAALAQQGPYDQAPQQGYYQQMPPQQMPQAQPGLHRHHGVMAIIREEMRAGRLSEKEGTLIAGKIKQLHAERREQRQARLNGQYAPPPQGAQQPR